MAVKLTPTQRKFLDAVARGDALRDDFTPYTTYIRGERAAVGAATVDAVCKTYELVKLDHDHRIDHRTTGYVLTDAGRTYLEEHPA